MTSKPTEVSEHPLRFMVGYLPGIERRDAKAFAQGFIERHFDALDTSGWYIMKHGDGWLYEVQEGGCGLAYLPSILAALKENEDRVYVKTTTRYVRIDQQGDEVVSLILPEDVLKDPTPNIAGGPPLHPARGDGKGWVQSGLTLFGSGLIALAVAAVSHFGTGAMFKSGMVVEDAGSIGKLISLLDREVPMNPAHLKTPDLNTLPIAQRDKLTPESGRYIEALKYQDRRWVVLSSGAADAATSTP